MVAVVALRRLLREELVHAADAARIVGHLCLALVIVHVHPNVHGNSTSLRPTLAVARVAGDERFGTLDVADTNTRASWMRSQVVSLGAISRTPSPAGSSSPRSAGFSASVTKLVTRCVAGARTCASLRLRAPDPDVRGDMGTGLERLFARHPSSSTRLSRAPMLRPARGSGQAEIGRSNFGAPGFGFRFRFRIRIVRDGCQERRRRRRTQNDGRSENSEPLLPDASASRSLLGRAVVTTPLRV
jgi:hypothetical protein